MQLAGIWPAKIITQYYLFVPLQKESLASSHSQKVIRSPEYSSRLLKTNSTASHHILLLPASCPTCSQVGINDEKHKILK